MSPLLSPSPPEESGLWPDLTEAVNREGWELFSLDAWEAFFLIGTDLMLVSYLDMNARGEPQGVSLILQG